MSDLQTEVKTRLDQLRKNQQIVDYHHAYGLLAAQLRHLLFFAEHPDNESPEYDAIAQEIFAQTIATAQYAAEELGVFAVSDIVMEDREKKQEQSKVTENLVYQLLCFCRNYAEYGITVQHPYQRDVKIEVVGIDEKRVRDTMGYLYEQNLLPSPCPQSLLSPRWFEQAERYCSSLHEGGATGECSD